MKIASVADVRAKFSGYLRTSEQGPVIITKNGKPVAVLLSVTDDDDIENIVNNYSNRRSMMK